MLRSVISLYGYKIRATDGEIGKVHEFFFDDEHWAVRYLVADTGGVLPGKKVLLFPIALAQPHCGDHVVPVGLSKNRIVNSPETDADKPVSRQHEIDLHAYYEWAPYWPPAGMPYASAVPPLAGLQDKGVVRHEEDGDPHLRSTREVTGYRIHALDGEIGHVDDFIVDDESWHLRYAVVDTKTWRPGKKVLVSPRWIKRVSWEEQELFVDLDRKQIEGAPEFDPSEPVNRSYEIQLYDYYGRPAYFS